jgi:tRNA threonylcarbamoyladenosine modification (KEOPS) complex Cgi121 subunit
MPIKQGNFVIVFYSNVRGCGSSIDPNHGTIINLKYVTSLFSLLRAIEKANLKFENQSEEKMMKNFQMEICSQLSVSKNVKEIIKVAQVGSDSHEIAVILRDTILDNHETILSEIEGDEADANLLVTLLTEEKKQSLTNYMKLTTEELSLCSFEDAVAMKIAVKDV